MAEIEAFFKKSRRLSVCCFTNFPPEKPEVNNISNVRSQKILVTSKVLVATTWLDQ